MQIIFAHEDVKPMPLRFIAAFAAGMTAIPSWAEAPRTEVPLAPHQAIYELHLADRSEEMAGATGRIAMALKSETCGIYKLDYRFVARFQQEQEITQTDQQTVSTENVAGTAFEFSTKTFVDGAADKEIAGRASHDGNATKVEMKEPEVRSFDLPLSRFPMQHTRELIEKAKAGEQIVEARLFDGDDDSEKLLTSTSIISPNAAAPDGGGAEPPKDAAEAAKGALQSEARALLTGLRSWRISEAYYNSDSDPDGLPVFQTSYILYENGVSDDLRLDFGDYVFAGSLSKLDLLDLPKCP